MQAFALALLALIASAPAHAETQPVESCIARIPAGQSAAQVIARPQAFDCQVNQSSLGNGDFVVRLRFPLERSQTADPLVLRISSVWQNSARAIFRYVDGGESQFDFDAGHISKALTIGAVFEVPVPAYAAPLDTAFIEVRGAANLLGLVVDPRLMKRSRSQELRTQMTILNSAFAGLALALIVYNLALWASMRHRFQLYYCGTVGALMAYTYTSSGLLDIMFPVLDSTVRLRLNYAFMMLTAALALQFARHFFGSRVVGRKLDRAIVALTALGGIAAAAVVFLSPWQMHLLDRSYMVAILGLILLVPSVLVQAWRAKSPYLPLVIAAWSAPLITSLLRAMHGFDVVGYSFWLDNGNLLALSLEALVSSLLVTARLRELSYERDDARAGEQVARRLAATDSLTGLLNRRSFLDLAIGRTSRQRLLLIDIDHFKLVNDRLGHAGGDDVLHAVASAIQACCPARSLAVRLGGEEFALLLPMSAYDECTPDMLLAAVRNCAMPQGIQVTMSVGFADGSVASEDDWKRLYRLADTALYRAKSDGRDRACRATDFRAVA